LHKDKRNLIQLLMSELKNLLKKVWKFSNNLKIKSIYIRNKVLILAFLSSYHSEESKSSNISQLSRLLLVDFSCTGFHFLSSPSSIPVSLDPKKFVQCVKAWTSLNLVSVWSYDSNFFNEKTFLWKKTTEANIQESW